MHKKLFRRRIIVIGGIILLAITFSSFKRNKAPEYNLAVAKRGFIREEVSVTGKIEDIDNIDLSFGSTGNVSRVLVENGSKVKKGQILASLENNNLRAQLKEAQANLEIEETKLQELKKGTREETINAKRIELSKAKQDLDNYYQDSLNVLSDAYSKSEEAIKIDTKDIFMGADAANSYVLTFDPCVFSEISLDADRSRLLSERELKKFKNELNLLNDSSSKGELDLAIKNAKVHLLVFKDFFEKLGNVLLADCSYSNPYLDIHRVNANNGRNLIIAAITNINNLEQSIASQKILIEKIQNELDLLLSGATKEDIMIQEAKIRSAQANLSNYYALLEKTIIRSPIDGFVAKKEIKEGEAVLANTPVISVISKKGLQVSAYVSEVDASKVAVGDKVIITLDAFPRKQFFGKIICIDSAETVIDGVVYYKVKSTIDTQDANVKSGMTADIIIITGSKEDALIIPRRAVLEKKGKSIVRIPVKGGFQETEVKTGLVSPEESIEIISGLKEGDKVITFIKKQ